MTQTTTNDNNNDNDNADVHTIVPRRLKAWGRASAGADVSQGGPTGVSATYISTSSLEAKKTT